ncbi:unnamed protein product [Amoebophrya sp. A25]|nr:unnamed protein product [Amoebophrya sp. A25]|eukprot:GSA25T00004965001.1
MNFSEACLYSYLYYVQADSSVISVEYLRKLSPLFLPKDGRHSDLDDRDETLQDHAPDYTTTLVSIQHSCGTDHEKTPLLEQPSKTTAHEAGAFTIDQRLEGDTTTALLSKRQTSDEAQESGPLFLAESAKLSSCSGSCTPRSLTPSARMKAASTSANATVDSVAQKLRHTSGNDKVVATTTHQTHQHPPGLHISNLRMKYRSDLPNYVLSNLSFSVAPGERCAVVGRTGAGKSSVAVAVFNLAEEIHGEIYLNGSSLLAPVPVNESRKRLGIITQDPVIFSGTVRQNLDPFFEFTDAECEQALANACLFDPRMKKNVGGGNGYGNGTGIGGSTNNMKNATSSNPVLALKPVAEEEVLQDMEDEDAYVSPPERPAVLHVTSPSPDRDRCPKNEQQILKHYELVSNLEESGKNLSLGERQLVCLARVLLRSPEMLICDEATASCDLETDALVQRAIRNWLAKQHKSGNPCCVLTIAHRLETIADYEKVLFLDKGRELEYGAPKDLLSDLTSNFAQLVRAAGPETEKRVRDIVFAEG